MEHQEGVGGQGPESPGSNTLTVQEVAAILAKSTDTIRRWMKAGNLRGGHVLPGPKGGELIYMVNKRVFLEWWESQGVVESELVAMGAE
jgi:excisionase family DNA binding protein